MRRNSFWKGAAAAAMALFLMPAGAAYADSVDALDANVGNGSQHNADDWEIIDNGMAGSGNQAAQTGGSANTGSGSQDNSFAAADLWSDMMNANAGSGAQVIDATNSNGGDRTSNDVVINLGDNAVVASAALQSAVTGNTIEVDGANAQASSTLTITDKSGFTNMYGINAIALSSGANASQNVSVNVTATVDVGGGY